MGTEQQSLTEVLLDAGIVTSEQLAELEPSRPDHRSLIRQVLDAEIISEERMVTELSRYLGLDSVDPVTTPVHPQVLSVISAETARRLRILPMARRRDSGREHLFVITVDPCDSEPAELLADQMPEAKVTWYLAGDGRMAEALDLHYGPLKPSLEDTDPQTDVGPHTRPALRMGGSAAVLEGLGALPAAPITQETAVTDTVETVSPLATPHVTPAVESKPATSPPSSSNPGFRSSAGVAAITSSSRNEPLGRSGSRYGNFKYQWGRPLGDLGWAVLREARDPEGGRVVIRQLRPDLRATDKVVAHFLGAAPQLLGVQHPNLVKVLEVGELEGRPFVVLQGRTGISLQQLLTAQEKQQAPMPLPLARRILEDVLNALAVGHGLTPPVVHGGLNASAVWIDADGRLRVDEFGMPRSLPDLSTEKKLPSTIESDLRAFGRLMIDVLIQKRSLTPVAMQTELQKRSEEGATAWGELVLRMMSPDAGSGFRDAMALSSVMASLPGKAATTDELAMYLEDVTSDGTDATLLEPEGMVAVEIPAPVHVPIITHKPTTGWSTPDTTQREAGLQSIQEQARRWTQWAVDTFKSSPLPMQVALSMAALVLLLVFVVSLFRGEPESPPVVRVNPPPSSPKIKPRAVLAADVTSRTDPAGEVRPDAPDAKPPQPELVAPPPLNGVADEGEDSSESVELAFGVLDLTAAEGFAFIARDDVALRMTASRRSKSIQALNIGARVEIIRKVQGQPLVMLPPRGPVGFVEQTNLADKTPLVVLGRAMGFSPCRVEANEPVDGCLYTAKLRLDTCRDQCKDKGGTRCMAACQSGFDQCVAGCQEPPSPPPKPPRRRRRGRR